MVGLRTNDGLTIYVADDDTYHFEDTVASDGEILLDAAGNPLKLLRTGRKIGRQLILDNLFTGNPVSYREHDDVLPFSLGIGRAERLGVGPPCPNVKLRSVGA
jgi:hypothetical protein